MPNYFIDLVLCHNHTSSRSSYMPDVLYSNRIYMHYTFICVICQADRLINPGLLKSYIAQLRPAAFGGQRRRERAWRGQRPRHALSLLWGGVGNAFDDF